MSGAGERAVDVAGDASPPHQLLRGAAGIDDRVVRLVLDLDELGGILGLGAGLRDHDRDRLTRVADLVLGQDRVGHGGEQRVLDPGDRERPGATGDVERGQRSEQARRPGGRGHRDDVGARVGAADERGVRHPRQLEVVEVAGLPAQDALVLAPADGLAEKVQAPDPLS